jgi:Reverse transcriptase (RNA-dependent DNA polymerase)
MRDIIKTMDPQLAEVLLKFLPVFDEPPHYNDIPDRPETIQMEQISDRTPKQRPLTRLSLIEDAILLDKLKQLLAKGWIQTSKSAYGASIIFAQKSDGGLRLCVDYRSLNSNTVKDSTPLPAHHSIREQIAGKRFLTKLDIRDAFHMIKLDLIDCQKTAFKTKYGLFEYTVVPFGLCNSPATFIRLMNRIFFDLMDSCMIHYVDDILIYSDTYEQHLIDISNVFQRLLDNQLKVKLTKCEFLRSKVILWNGRKCRWIRY